MTIGLTYTGNPEKNQFYIDWLKETDDINILRLSAENNNLVQLNDCDALVLSGGVDIHPWFYGNEQTDYANAPENFNEQRDEFEIRAFHSAQQNKIPVLGICRGMQLINVIQNGTLQQDLGNEILIKTHKGNPDKSHPVHVEGNSLLYEITGDKQLNVNSAHHQAIEKLGDGLIINARAEDGTPEGIEWKEKNNKPFLLAVQWHPERLFRFDWQQSPAAKLIRERFIKEIKKSIDHKNDNH